MTVGHQVTGRFPALDVAGGNGPGGAGQLAFAGQKLLIHWRAENGEALSPFLDFGELLDGHGAGEEEVLGLAAQALNHVLLGDVVIVARGNGVAVHVERGEELEHLLDLFDVGLLVHRGVGRHLEAQQLGHADGFDAFLEHPFALDDEVVRVFQAVHVDIPVEPLSGLDDGVAIVFALADGLDILVRDEFLAQQPGERRLQRRRVNSGKVVLELLPHEQAVRADIDDAALGQQPGHQLLDLGINQRFAAADRDHRRVALLRGGKAILEGHHVLEAGGILADAAATGAGEIAGVQRFELQHERKPRGAQNLVLNDVTGDSYRQRERKSHRMSVRSERSPRPAGAAAGSGPVPRPMDRLA